MAGPDSPDTENNEQTMLAYVFWHRPEEAIGAAEYERHLVAFHAALSRHSPAGFIRSTTYRVDEIPWLDRRAGYEDWYVLESSAALDRLNEAAVSGTRRLPHDAAAHRMAAAAAALMQCRLAGPEIDASRSEAVWLDRPPALSALECHARLAEVLPAGTALWQRQMGLGPTPQFCAVGGLGQLNLPPEWTPTVLSRGRVWPAAG